MSELFRIRSRKAPTRTQSTKTLPPIKLSKDERRAQLKAWIANNKFQELYSPQPPSYERSPLAAQIRSLSQTKLKTDVIRESSAIRDKKSESSEVRGEMNDNVWKLNLELKRRNKRDVPRRNFWLEQRQPSEEDSNQSSVIEFHIDDLAQLTKPLERYRPSSRTRSLR